ncbi:MAG TPA: aminotransferase class I/II-fold pyridoxal phosphate-dependent enzyme [Bacilli bacterium]
MKSKQMATTCIHAGRRAPVRNRPEATPIYQTSVFTFADLDDVERFFAGEQGTYLYSRYGNPNCSVVEAAIAAMEGGADAVVTSSGMAAILCALLAFAKAGDHVLCSDEIYGATATLLQTELQKLGVECSFVSCHQEENVIAAIRPNTRALFAEVVTNPLISVVDIGMLARIAHERGAKLIVDNTFTTPYVVRPLEKGADLVIHSVTKYLNGHNDVVAGVVVGNDPAVMDDARQRMKLMGLNLGPFAAWLVERGLKTFALRMRQHCANAEKVARFLQSHPMVSKVYYPLLESHRTFAVAERLGLHAGGGMLSFVTSEETEKLNRMFRAMEMIVIAPSLAGIATTMSHPLRTSHRLLAKEKQRELGITNGLIRLSVGIEAPEDIIADLAKGLAAME